MNTIREQWLIKALGLIGKHLAKTAEIELPEAVRVSVGFPGGRRKTKHAIGQCWPNAASKDAVAEIFISPILDNPEEVLATLLHEAIHATVGCKCGHKGAFKRAAVSAGLEGKMTATVAGPALKETIQGWIEKLGKYSHAALDPAGPNSGPKKQGTRLVKCSCAECGYIVRTTAIWIETGPPICPCNHEDMVVEGAGDEGGGE